MVEPTRVINTLKSLSVSGQEVSVQFVTPLHAVCLAGRFQSRAFDSNSLSFACDARNYAENCGLLFHLGLSQEIPIRGGKSGLTYCPIESIIDAAEVDGCNQRIASLLRSQLGSCPNKSLVNATCGVVGELHDNIASHARGRGFSAAQVYRGGQQVIQIAIADVGQGIGPNVRRAGLDLTDPQAIEWCLQRGNTTANLKKQVDSLIGPQRLGIDSIWTPYPDSTPTTNSDNHHMGEGLYRLTELIRETGGETWIWSGKSAVECKKNARIPIVTDIEWTGTVIAIEIPIVAFEKCVVALEKPEYDQLAKRLGL